MKPLPENPPVKPAVYDLDMEDWTQVMLAWRESAFRARQIWEGLYKHLWSKASEFTNLPVSIRQRLAQEYEFSPLAPDRVWVSSDEETTKTLFSLRDGRAIEAVLMNYDRRDTLCISSQAGCAMGCVFCATGQMGFKRHLTSGEIVAQVVYYGQLLRQMGKRVTNVVVMGMGEPFHNYDATLAAIDRLNHPDGMALGARRFTISTVGLAPVIRRFAEEQRQINLAISLHAVTDEARSAMMLVNKKYPISELLDACRFYVHKTGRRISFEWALIRGVNDSPEVARQLGFLVKGILCHVNVIPLNPTSQFPGQATTQDRAQAFCAELQKLGIPCTVRIRRGIDIAAGCGQLAIQAGGES